MGQMNRKICDFIHCSFVDELQTINSKITGKAFCHTSSGSGDSSKLEGTGVERGG